MQQIIFISHCLPEIGFSMILFAFHFLVFSDMGPVYWPQLREQLGKDNRVPEFVNVQQTGPVLKQYEH